MKNLREENLEILKLNALYVIQNSKKYFVNESLEPSNYKYINDIVRNKLMKDLLNFNPKIHMKKLESLAEINPEIRNDLENLKNNIDMDLDELLDKHYYKKKEKELKEKSGEDKGLPRIENHKRIKRGKTSNREKSHSDKKKVIKNNDNSSNDSGKNRKNIMLNIYKDKPISPIKKGKVGTIEQRGKKVVKKPNTLDCKTLTKIVLEIYNRCKEYLETGSPVPDQLKKYFEDVENKFLVKSNISKTNSKHATQFQVKTDDPEYKLYFDLDNPKYLDHQIKTYFPKVDLAQNSLQDIVHRTLNPNPGYELEKASSSSNKYYMEIKTMIDKAKQKVQEIIPKQEYETDKKNKHITFK